MALVETQDLASLRTPRVKWENRVNLAGPPDRDRTLFVGAIIQNFNSYETHPEKSLKETQDLASLQ